ncbi:MAG: D-Ala-D-Ala carboxypeptidase family metallohydrolase [Bacteroidales bacterium]|nr:D-Ala-D-Ala carboxypeptidase family metallohydrolase [Bacteroidales bacterium]
MKYFTIAELTKSDTANRLGIGNTPSVTETANLMALVNYVLDPLREAFGSPISVSSGFRSSKLNSAVGGSKTSDHSKGCAADIYATKFRDVADMRKKNLTLFQWIIENCKYNQVIWEKGSADGPQWVHVAYHSDGTNKMQILRTIDGKTYYNCDKNGKKI